METLPRCEASSWANLIITNTLAGLVYHREQPWLRAAPSKPEGRVDWTRPDLRGVFNALCLTSGAIEDSGPTQVPGYRQQQEEPTGDVYFLLH